MLLRFGLKICIIFLFFAINFTQSREICAGEFFECKEDDKEIPCSSVCDGKADCPYGSDESFVICKSTPEENNDMYFYCASGAAMEFAVKDNHIYDCWDGSDEIAEFDAEKWQGNCTKDEIQCLPNECIQLDQVCNGEHDCSNGLDESLEFCMQPCESQYFQCANGQCIAAEGLCDGEKDCIDGADELPDLCNEYLELNQEPGQLPANCSEPRRQGLRFVANDTKFEVIHGDQRYVWANGAVHLECMSATLKLVGQAWNVCLQGGIWRHSLPICLEADTEFIPKADTNDDTNGKNGCPLAANELERPIMYKKNITLVPPIKNKEVHFRCAEGLHLYPGEVHKLFCNGTTMQWLKRAPPVCLKLCDEKTIIEHYSLKPSCRTSHKETVNCNDEKARLPGSEVTYGCATGYVQIDTLPTLKCLSSGSWSINGNWRKEPCLLDCGKNFNTSITPSSTKAHRVQPNKVPWHVGLYRKEHAMSSTYKHNCGGTLIRLDVVLTAAHCVWIAETHIVVEQSLLSVSSSKNSRRIYTDLPNIRAVRRVRVDPGFAGEINYHRFDLAILELETPFEHTDFIKPICLPWFNEKQAVRQLAANLEGEVASWESVETRNLQIVGTVVKEGCISNMETDHICIRATNKTKMCSGDSGNGFVASCESGKAQKCLFGIVIAVLGGGTCSSSMLATNILTNLTRYRNMLDEYAPVGSSLAANIP